MFKKLKDKIEEEFKQAPLKFPVSVQQLAQVISPSQSVNSLSDNNASSSSLAYPADMSNISSDFFSISGDDDPQSGTNKMSLTMHNVDLSAASPSSVTHNTSRSRRSSLSSVTSEPSLFPIYESGINQNFFQSDLESEMEDGMSGQIDRVSKEQLYQSFKKILNRYNKYKGRYTDLLKHYKELQHENFKTKNVLQESQDKALRRMAELREQCQLEQKAKAHLEESLRNDVEERDHIIDTLKTKITLLSNGTDNEQLIDLEVDGSDSKSEDSSQSNELKHLKTQNDELQKEVERLKKIKETACNFIHRCDTTINEASEDVKSDNIKQKMSELKFEIQKMKVENESLSHLLSKNLLVEDDRKSQTSDNTTDLESSQGDEKDKKIEKLNNLLLKCKEKINGLNAEIKAKNLIIEDNNKKLKELKDEVVACKAREEENTLLVAENKKAIHEELNAKEEQIKNLTKELKTKENEFINEKAEVIKTYEDKIRDMTTNFTKEIKLKNELNQKLQESLKAKEIVSGSLDKMKSIEENFANMLEFVKAKSSAFEDFAKSKTVEIEKAQDRLEEKVSIARKNLTLLVENAKKSAEQSDLIAHERAVLPESKNPNAEVSENFHIVEKLKTDVINLSKKLEILESELLESKSELKAETDEKEKWKVKHATMEAECEKIKNDLQEKLNENTELQKALSEANQKPEEKFIQETSSSNKIESEPKPEKLQKESQTETDQMQDYATLLRELNLKKSRIMVLENQENELKKIKNQFSVDFTKVSAENQGLKQKIEALNEELDVMKTKLRDSENELGKMESVNKKVEALKSEEEEKVSKLNDQIVVYEKELKELDKKNKELENNLVTLQEEMSVEKNSSETVREELETLRNELELKKANVVDEGTECCDFDAEQKLELEKGVEEKNNLIDNLREELGKVKKEAEDSKAGLEEMTKKNDDLSSEINLLKQQQISEEAAKTELNAFNEELKNKLNESEKTRESLNDKLSELTEEKDKIFVELQERLNESETLKNGLKSLRDELDEKTKAFEEEKLQLMSESENKLNILKNEIKFMSTKHEEDIGNFEQNLNSEMKEVNEKMEIAEKTSAELLEKLEKITNERNELKVAEEEKNLKISELENCMMALKAELDERFNDEAKEAEKETKQHGEEIKQIIMQYDKEIAERDEEIESLKFKLASIEDKISQEEEAEIREKHREEVKQIIIQYDREIGKRDEEIDSLKSKLSGYDDALEHLKTAKEELKILRRELSEKDSVIEDKLEETVRLKENSQADALREDVLALKENLKILKAELEEQKKETERVRAEKEKIFEEEKKKWDEEVAGLRQKHANETKTWNSQNKNINTEKSLADPEIMEDVELERMSKVAVAALETGSGSIELLQKQLIQQAAEMKELKKQHKREIIELKKMSSRRKSRRNSSENQDWLMGGLENDTEHEYLRNILYEYMMGKEQLVLAKVLSAIVKFNDEQTHNVLEKEQQRQTLLGQLGLL